MVATSVTDGTGSFQMRTGLANGAGGIDYIVDKPRNRDKSTSPMMLVCRRAWRTRRDLSLWMQRQQVPI